LATPIALHRINPETKPTYLEWTVQRHQNALTLIPNEFTGRAGKKETIRKPVVHEGAIVCGPVSGSPEYNEKLKGIDRKVLAIETESGGMFGVAYNRRVPAISIRGISDYAGAGIDKNKFDEETNRNARAVAALNAATFLTHQLLLLRHNDG
jgi:nucleoside phosphorylase